MFLYRMYQGEALFGGIQGIIRVVLMFGHFFRDSVVSIAVLLPESIGMLYIKAGICIFCKHFLLAEFGLGV